MNTFKNDEPSFASYGHLIEETKFFAESFVVFSVSIKKNCLRENYLLVLIECEKLINLHWGLSLYTRYRERGK